MPDDLVQLVNDTPDEYLARMLGKYGGHTKFCAVLRTDTHPLDGVPPCTCGWYHTQAVLKEAKSE